jgi:ubiquinone/menaquinone biosynthesis C-methylase UbiE
VNIDFSRIASEYLRFRPAYPPDLFSRLRNAGLGGTGGSILDLGSGPGNAAISMLDLGFEVVLSDLSKEMLVLAKGQVATSTDAGFVCCEASQLPFTNECFDGVVCGQAWHLFDQNVTACEVNRVLKCNGLFGVFYISRVALPGNIVESTNLLIREINREWSHNGVNGLYPEFLPALSAAGFQMLETSSFDVEIPYCQETWVGRIAASKGVGASLTTQKTEEFCKALTEITKPYFNGGPVLIPHRVFLLTARKA